MKKTAHSATLRQTDSGNSITSCFCTKKRAPGEQRCCCCCCSYCCCSSRPNQRHYPYRRSTRCCYYTQTTTKTSNDNCQFHLNRKSFFCRQSFFMKKPHTLPPLGRQIPALSTCFGFIAPCSHLSTDSIHNFRYLRHFFNW